MSFHRVPLGQKVRAPSKTEGRKHMALVAACPCVICQRWPVQVHHVIHDRFSQRKSWDTETISLCLEHHNALHADKTAWRAAYGADWEYLPVVADMIAGEFIEPRADRVMSALPSPPLPGPSAPRQLFQPVTAQAARLRKHGETQ